MYTVQSYRVTAQATPQTDLSGPAGSVAFGTQVTTLPNGNVVITDPLFNAGAVQGAGAVYLYSASGTLINQMIGVTASDNVGSGGVTVLSNGDYVVATPTWGKIVPPPINLATFAGAVTMCSGVTGCPSQISESNSLTGDKGDALVGGTGSSKSAVTALSNGKFVIRSYRWVAPNSGSHVGAVTLCDGLTNSCANKIVSTANSLVGSSVDDGVGVGDLTILPNGDYLVSSPMWDKTSLLTDTGAITKCSGVTGCVGAVSSANSLTGVSAGDQVGMVINNPGGTVSGGIFVLPNNLFVVADPVWNGAGAVTLCNAATNSCTGQTVNPTNSLTGSTYLDHIGANIGVLPNGDYVMTSYEWDRPGAVVAVDAGAVTLCRAASNSCAGQSVSAANSFTGPTGLGDYHRIGYGGTFILPNGNYVVSSPTWRPNLSNASYGAATYCNAVANSCAGVSPSAANSFTGDLGDAVSQAGVSLRSGITVLSNGNYVITSPSWIDRTTNPITQYVGAVTLCNGSTGCTGSPNRANSLTGSAQTDYAGFDGVTALANGNYVVNTSSWFSFQVPLRSAYGASTLCSGVSNNCAGQRITSANSLTGTKTADLVGISGTVALPSGNYVVGSGLWGASASTTAVGAMTFCNATSNSCAGQQVSSANSLTGTATDDRVGIGAIEFFNTISVLPNGNYALRSPTWNNGSTADAGALTIGSGSTGLSGAISNSNSVRGQTAGGGGAISYATGSNSRLYVGRPKDNKVTIVGGGARTPFDFDGDGKTDLSIFRPNGANGAEWWWLKSSNGGNGAVQFGAATETIAAADFTGDGKTDVAFWRPSTGFWFVLRSEDFSFYAFPFGATGDVPVPADYDGDGKADAAVFRESAVTWFINKSSGGTDIVGFGAAGDKPVNADYDGDGKADIAIYRPNGPGGAEWWVRRSSNASVFALQFGSSTDKAVPGDFTGDGKADVAFWRPATGFWNILRSEDFSYYAFPFGANGDVASPGDYDGDGKLDAAVFRPSNSTWYANRSTAGTLIQQFGAAGDVPVPSAFVR